MARASPAITEGNRTIPLLEIPQGLHQHIKVQRIRTVKVIFIAVGSGMFLRRQTLVEGVLYHTAVREVGEFIVGLEIMKPSEDTITRITTQGRFRDFTISMATEVLPDPELPAIPMILKSAHGGEYRLSVADEYTGEIDCIFPTLTEKLTC